jgi:hypothetical protein
MQPCHQRMVDKEGCVMVEKATKGDSTQESFVDKYLLTKKLEWPPLLAHYSFLLITPLVYVVIMRAGALSRGVEQPSIPNRGKYL